MHDRECLNESPNNVGSDDANSGFSTFDSEVSEPAAPGRRSLLRLAGSALAFVPFADWDPEQSYENEPTIRYNVEWKVFAKNRGQSGRIRA